MKIEWVDPISCKARISGFTFLMMERTIRFRFLVLGNPPPIFPPQGGPSKDNFLHYRKQPVLSRLQSIQRKEEKNKKVLRLVSTKGSTPSNDLNF